MVQSPGCCENVATAGTWRLRLCGLLWAVVDYAGIVAGDEYTDLKVHDFFEVSNDSGCKFFAAACKNWTISDTMKFVVYNPMYANNGDRLFDISTALRTVDIIALPATSQRHTNLSDKSQYVDYLPYHWGVSAGYGRARLSTSSCGTILLFKKTKFEKRRIARIWVAEGDVKGRGLAVRLKSETFDITPGTLYWPVWTGKAKQQAAYEETCTKVKTFWHSVMKEVPARSTPMWGMDLNSDLGIQNIGGNLIFDDESSIVGRAGTAGVERYAGKCFREVCAAHFMVAANTYYKVGKTYFGAKSASRIDFIALPEALLVEADFMTLLWSVVRALQLIKTREVRDHVPLMWKGGYNICWSQQLLKPQERWDFDKRAAGLQCGLYRKEIVERVEHRLEQERERVPTIIDDKWELWVRVVREEGLRLFSQGKAPPLPGYEEYKKEREQALADRRQLRIDLGKLPDSPDLEEEMEVVKVRLTIASKQCRKARKKSQALLKTVRVSELRSAHRKGLAAEVGSLGRLLAGTGVGIPRRLYRVARSPATVSDWKKEVCLPSTEGGMSAVINFEDEHERWKDMARAEPNDMRICDMQTQQEASEDLKRWSADLLRRLRERQHLSGPFLPRSW